MSLSRKCSRLTRERGIFKKSKNVNNSKLKKIEIVHLLVMIRTKKERKKIKNYEYAYQRILTDT